MIYSLLTSLIAFLLVFITDIFLISTHTVQHNIILNVFIEEIAKFLAVYFTFFKIFSNKSNFLMVGLFYGIIEFLLYFIIFHGYGINFVLIRYLVIIIHIITFINLYYAMYLLKVKRNVLVSILILITNIVIHSFWNYFTNYIL